MSGVCFQRLLYLLSLSTFLLGNMLLKSVTALSFLLVSSSYAQISKCPTVETQILTSDGSVYAVCPQSDYAGETTKFVGGLTSVTDCAKACNQEPQCKQAVYQQGGCHLKRSDRVQWIANTGYTSIRFVSKLEDGDAITTCISGFQNVTTSTGATYSMCPFSDYSVPSNDIQSNVATAEDCVQRCAQRPDCAYASYYTPDKVCHLKGTLSAPRWVFNNQFTSIRRANAVVAPPQSSSTPATQPSSQSSTATSSSTPTSTAPVAKLGKWGNIIQFPIIPVAAYVVPGGPSPSRILVFSSWGDRAFSGPTVNVLCYLSPFCY